MMELVWPADQYLPGYVHALQQGWSPDNLRPEAAQEPLAQIARDAGDFVARQVDCEGKGTPVTLPDGSIVPRLPGFALWIWDGEFLRINRLADNLTSQRVIEKNGGTLIERLLQTRFVWRSGESPLSHFVGYRRA